MECHFPPKNWTKAKTWHFQFNWQLWILDREQGNLVVYNECNGASVIYWNYLHLQIYGYCAPSCTALNCGQQLSHSVILWGALCCASSVLWHARAQWPPDCLSAFYAHPFHRSCTITVPNSPFSHTRNTAVWLSLLSWLLILASWFWFCLGSLLWTVPCAPFSQQHTADPVQYDWIRRPDESISHQNAASTVAFPFEWSSESSKRTTACTSLP